MTSNDDRFGTKFEYDPLWKGPMTISRRVTDRNWLIVFISYFVIYFVCAIYAFVAGDLRKLDDRLDSTGHTCGIDRDVIDKPYIMYLNLRQAARSDYSPRICVSECPTENFRYDKTEPVNEIRKKLICTADVNVTCIQTIHDIDILMANDKCAQWYLKSYPILGRCIAYNSWEGHKYERISKLDGNVLNGEYYMKKFYRISKSVWLPVLSSIFFTIILTLLSVLLFRWFAKLFFYTSIYLFIAMLTIAIYFLTDKYIRESKSPKINLIAIILCVFILIAIVIAVLYARKKIHLACLLVQQSAKAVIHLPATIVYPWVTGLLQIAIFIFAIIFFLYLVTITKPSYTIQTWFDDDRYRCYCNNNYYSIGDFCNPDEFNYECTDRGYDCEFKRCGLNVDRMPVASYFIHIINIFGSTWLIYFFNGLEFMVLGGTFATWYWTLQKSDVRNYALIESLARAIQYHLGTIALGSLVLMFTHCINLFIHAVQKVGESRQLSLHMLGFQSNMFRDIIKFLNKNAYIMCAMHGKNFFQSAKSAFNLIMRNLTKVIIVHEIAEIMFMVAELLIIYIVIDGLIMHLNNTLSDDSDDKYWIFWITIIVSLIGIITVANAFFDVINNAVHTIFLCFIEDTERNDGSTQRPYYMSTKLEEVLQR